MLIRFGKHFRGLTVMLRTEFFRVCNINQLRGPLKYSFSRCILTRYSAFDSLQADERKNHDSIVNAKKLAGLRHKTKE